VTYVTQRRGRSADIEIAIDTTASMNNTIAQAKADATSIVNTVKGSIADAHFAVVQFRDSGDTPEYQLMQPMTDSAPAVQTAINGLTPGGGGDFPEAHNLVFHNSYADPSIGFRSTARKFVIVLSDAQPHGAGTFSSLQPGCNDTSADPHGLSTTTELAGMKTAELTLFMVRQAATATSSLQCYQQIAAQAFTGGQGVDGGANLGTQIVTLINSAVQSINQVTLDTVPASFASWASFNPASPYGPVTAPFDKAFTETIKVPLGTAPGDYSFDVRAQADGATRAVEHVNVHVPPLRGGKFTCRGAGARVLGGDLAVSNGPNDPCQDKSAALLNLPLGSGQLALGANLVNSSTGQTPDDLNSLPAVDDRGEADAKATVVTLVAGLTTVKASVVSSHAEARCEAPLGGPPALSGSSTIASLTVNGNTVPVGSSEIKINVLLGVLHINSTVKTATGVTQRGIWFENKVLPSSLDVVAAEAKAGYSGNPCA
jgi:Mg-chelatase subunit ChlD